MVDGFQDRVDMCELVERNGHGGTCCAVNGMPRRLSMASDMQCAGICQMIWHHL
jgi:hypothetical protein